LKKEPKINLEAFCEHLYDLFFIALDEGRPIGAEQLVERLKRKLMKQALKDTDYCIQYASDRLKIKRTTFYNLVKEKLHESYHFSSSRKRKRNTISH
jgi:transcriptional regulator of acetoin/glycerol metabolism